MGCLLQATGDIETNRPPWTAPDSAPRRGGAGACVVLCMSLLDVTESTD